jgi:hypothetical protein
VSDRFVSKLITHHTSEDLTLNFLKKMAETVFETVSLTKMANAIAGEDDFVRTDAGR